MMAITKSLINKGILNYDIQFDELFEGKAFIFLDKNEKLDKAFFEKLWEVKQEYGANTEITYSQKHDCILITFY